MPMRDLAEDDESDTDYWRLNGLCGVIFKRNPEYLYVPNDEIRLSFFNWS